MSEWISVKDGMPVITQDPQTGEPIQYIVMIKGAELATSLIFDGKGWVDFDKPSLKTGSIYYTVSHWMEMPEPPKEDDDEG